MAQKGKWLITGSRSSLDLWEIKEIGKTPTSTAEPRIAVNRLQTFVQESKILCTLRWNGLVYFGCEDGSIRVWW